MSLSGESFSRECGSFSRGGGEGGGVKRDDGFYREQAVKSPLPIIPRAASSLLLLRLLFHLASPFFMFFPLSYTVVYQLPHRAHIFAWARRKVTDIFLWSAVRGRRGVWKLLNARNARFNWYESRRTRVFSIYIYRYFRGSLWKRVTLKKRIACF